MLITGLTLLFAAFPGNRRLSVVTVSLVAVLAVTALPTIFYIWDPPAIRNSPAKQSGSVSESCDNGQSVNWSSLVGSVCANYLNWYETERKPALYSKKISTLKCDFENTEKNLQQILALLTNFRDEEQCQKQATPLLCHYIYQDCDGKAARPTTNDCMKVKHGACKLVWDAAENFLSTASSQLSSCIGIPDCSTDFNNISTTKQTSSFSESTTSVVPLQNKSTDENTTDPEVPCRPPLVKTELNDAIYGLKCSPACLEENWSSKPELAAMEVMLYLTGIVSLFCVVVTFVTWANVAELRQFPQNTLLFLVIAYAIAMFGFTLPLLVGRRNAYCEHKDMLSTFHDPSIICILQGFLVHVGLTSALVWWLCSIFNVFVSVYVSSPVNPIRRHKKTVLFVETLSSVILPVGLAATVLGVEKRYATFSVQIITCGPPSILLMYYTMALPLQLIVFVGVVMTLLVMLRLRKVQDATKRSTSFTISSSTQTTIQNRFLMVVVFFPLCFGIIMSTIFVYEKLSEDAVTSYVEYIVTCLQRTTEVSVCEDLNTNYGSIITSIVDLLMFNIFSLVLLAYVLVPTMARKFWINRLRNVRSRLVTLLPRDTEVRRVETEPGDTELTLTSFTNRVTDPYTEITTATPNDV